MNDTIGQRLATLRGKRSRKEFAELLGLHLNTLANYERGERTPDVVFASSVCKLLGVSSSWLLMGEGPIYDPERTTVVPARVGTMRCGDPLSRVVVKEKAEEAPKAAPGLDGLLQETEALRRECGELRAENRELRQENRELRLKNEDLVNQNAELRIEVQALKLRPDRDQNPEEEPLARKSA